MGLSYIVVVISIIVLEALLLVRYLSVRYVSAGLSYCCCCYQYYGFGDVFIGEICIFD